MKIGTTLIGALTLTTAIWAAHAYAQGTTSSEGSWVPSALMNADGTVREDAYIQPPPHPAADNKYDVPALDGVHLKRDYMMPIMAVSDRSRDDGNKYWGRIAGTKYEVMTSDVLQANFKKMGMVNIRQQDFDLPPQWFAIDWSLTASGGGKNLTFTSVNPALGSAPTPAAGLSLPIVWAGQGLAADFLNLGNNVKGKAVLIFSDLEPGAQGNSASWEGSIKRATDAGAAAIIVIWGDAGNQQAWDGVAAGRGDKKVPAFYVGYEDGKALRDLVGTGQTVTANMSLKTEIRPGLQSHSAYGTLPGKTDENIIVMAHMDGYAEAALDNGSGLSAMEGIAEYFSTQKDRRRNMIFIGTAGHHAGSPNARWLHEHNTGSFIDITKTALMISPEHISFSDFYKWNQHYQQTNQLSYARWSVWGSSKLMDISLSTWKEYGIGLTGLMDKRASGEMGQVAHDAPSIEIIRSPEWKHTLQDVPSVVPAIGLERTAKAYAKIIDEVNKLDLKDIQPMAQKSASN